MESDLVAFATAALTIIPLENVRVGGVVDFHSNRLKKAKPTKIKLKL